MAQTQIADVIVPAELTAYQVENSDIVYQFLSFWRTRAKRRDAGSTTGRCAAIHRTLLE